MLQVVPGCARVSLTLQAPPLGVELRHSQNDSRNPTENPEPQILQVSVTVSYGTSRNPRLFKFQEKIDPVSSMGAGDGQAGEVPAPFSKHSEGSGEGSSLLEEDVE